MPITPLDMWSFGMVIAAYVLTALGLYTIAKRRGIKRPWLAWIPVADMWLLGCISDQYRYVARGQVQNKRKTMLILNIVWMLLLIWVMVMLVVLYLQIAPYLPEAMRDPETFSQLYTMTEEEQTAFMEQMATQIGMPPPHVLQTITVEAVIVAVPALVMLVCMVAYVVMQYQCYYDVFASTEPISATMRLVLSIVAQFFGVVILRPLFVFTSRNRDDGMPPKAEQGSKQLPYSENSREQWL